MQGVEKPVQVTALGSRDCVCFDRILVQGHLRKEEKRVGVKRALEHHFHLGNEMGKGGKAGEERQRKQGRGGKPAGH